MAPSPLFQLQVVDTELDRRNERLKAISRLLGNQSSLAELRKQLTDVQIAYQKVTAHQRELDLAIATHSDKITQTEAKLYSGNVTSPRELKDLQADIDQTKKQRTAVEDDLLPVLDEVEKLRQQLTELNEKLHALEDKWKADQVSMTAEQKTLQAEVAELTQQRSTVAATVPATHLPVYEQVRKIVKNGQAVARLDRDQCGACRIGLPAATVQRVRTSPAPVRCNNCQRILLMQ